jgi:hypothetical protein
MNQACLIEGCPVVEWTIACDSCGHSWKVAGTYSVYERQAVESCPCPDCAAYTLCCAEERGAEGEARSVRLPERWRALAG